MSPSTQHYSNEEAMAAVLRWLAGRQATRCVLTCGQKVTPTRIPLHNAPNQKCLGAHRDIDRMIRLTNHKSFFDLYLIGEEGGKKKGTRRRTFLVQAAFIRIGYCTWACPTEDAERYAEMLLDWRYTPEDIMANMKLYLTGQVSFGRTIERTALAGFNGLEALGDEFGINPSK